MDETKRVIVEQDDDVKVIVKPSAASKKLTVDDEHEMGLSWDEEGVHFRVDETDDLPVSKAVDSDTVDGKHASDLQNYNNLTNKPDLKKVATTGSYNDLEDKPEFLKVQVQADWNETNKRSKAYIKNKPTSFSSDGGDADTVDGKHASDLQDYNNLTNKPDIPVVAGNAENAVRLKNGKDDYQMGEGAVCLSTTAQARGNFSFAEGNNTYTFVENAHAEGFGTIAVGSSHAEGYLTIADGISTIMTVEEYSENVVTLGNRYECFREELIDEFFENAVIGSQLAFTNRLPEGSGNLFIAAITAIDKENRQITLDKALDTEAEYMYACPVTTNESMEYCTAHAEGNITIATGIASHAEGEDSTASGYASHSEGCGTIATGIASHAEGECSKASEWGAHAEGMWTEANGEVSHAEGDGSIATGYASHAEGGASEAEGKFSHAEGMATAYGEASHAEGYDTTTEGKATHAEGYNTIATTLHTAMEIDSMTDGDTGTVITVKTENTAFDKEKIDAFFEQAEPEDNLCVVQIYSNMTFNKKVTILSVDKDAYTITVKETFGSNLYGDYIYPIGKTSSVTESAHAEGSHSVATGYASHAEGYQTIASGKHSHAEGQRAYSCGEASHAEGLQARAIGVYSHAEGFNAVSSGKASHAEGQSAYSCGEASHAEGNASITAASSSHAEGEYTTAAGGAGMRVSAADIAAKTITLSNENDDMFSQDVVIQFFNSVKQGDKLIVSGFFIKQLTIASVDKNNHSIVVNEDLEDWILSKYIVSYIYKVNAGRASHAEGSRTATANIAAHAEGQQTKAIGEASHAEGQQTKAIGAYSHAEGYITTANDYQHTGGKFNTNTAGGVESTTEGSAFIIGNGTSEETRSNCFRVQFDGKVFSQGEYATTGADYAELFEWEDQNKQAQDRRGLFVALKGTKIHIADSTDKNIIGIISSKPAMVGNNYSETWKDMYLTDLWGDVITQRKTIPAKYETVKNVVFEKDKNGEEKEVVKEEQILVSEAYEADIPVLNPDYNKDMVYIPRHERKEWGIVGMLGQLIVEDDGSCEADGYCKCADGGIATKADSGYYIMERIDASHIRVLFK